MLGMKIIFYNIRGTRCQAAPRVSDDRVLKKLNNHEEAKRAMSNMLTHIPHEGGGLITLPLKPTSVELAGSRSTPPY